MNKIYFIKTILFQALIFSQTAYLQAAINFEKNNIRINTSLYENNSSEITIPKNIKQICVSGLVATASGYVAIRTYLAYKFGAEQLEALKMLNNNPDYKYENFIISAQNLYYKHTLFPNSTSLYSDHPDIWLEKIATSNKNWLKMFSFFQSLGALSKNLQKELIILRQRKEFRESRIVYNQQLRLTKVFDRVLAI